MPRPRTKQNKRQTDKSSVYLPFYIIPPLSVIAIVLLFSSIVLNPRNKLDLPFRSSEISPIYTPEIQYWSEAIHQWALRFNLDPDMVATVMQIESCGNPKAVSSAGAMGLFQVMPFHFAADENPFNPNINARRGLEYLKRSLETANGNTRLAFAGYNGGISIIHRPESEWSAQTQRYTHYAESIYRDARSGSSFSLSINEWHEKYGVYLCLKARQIISEQ